MVVAAVSSSRTGKGVVSRGSALCRAADVSKTSSTRSGSKQEQIYLGKGTFITDDPSKYPDKDDIGVGGWAGGEKGLQQFVAQAGLEAATEPKAEPPSQRKPSALGEGKDTIYVGQGQYIQDDSRRYPSKEDAGFIVGAAGGFAGGERGLQQFLESGKIEPAAAEVVRQRQTKRDAIALLGLGVVSGASYLAYLYLSGQPLPEIPDLETIAQSASTAKDTVSGVASSATSTVPIEQLLMGVAAVAAVAGTAVGVSALKKAADAVGAKLVDGAKDNATKLLVLGLAVAVYVTLLD